MSLINIRQIRNLPIAQKGSIIVFDGFTNNWSNQNNEAILISVGNTSQRPVSAEPGMIRYNTDFNNFEVYTVSGWRQYISEINITQSATGSGIPIIQSVSSNINTAEIIHRTIVGNNIEVSSVGGQIILSAQQIPTFTVSNLGGSQAIAIDVSANKDFRFRSIGGAGIIDVRTSGNRIVVSAPNISFSSQNKIFKQISLSSHTFLSPTPVYYNDVTNLWTSAQSNNQDTLALGVTEYVNENEFNVVFCGIVGGFTGISAGNYYFVDNANKGKFVSTEPTSGFSNPIIYALNSSSAVVLPYRPYDIDSGSNYLVNVLVSSLGSGESVIRNIENSNQIIQRTIQGSGAVELRTDGSNIIVSSKRYFPSIHFFATSFDSPNNPDWPVSAAAPANSDSLNNALTVRQFDDTQVEGVGFYLNIVEGANTIRFLIKERREISGASADVQWSIFYRAINNNSSISVWSSAAFAPHMLPDNTFFQYRSQVFLLSSLGLTPGILYQFTLARIGSSTTDTLSGDVNLLELQIDFS